MTDLSRIERDLPGILGELGAGPAPDYADRILARTAAAGQRSGWWLPGRLGDVYAVGRRVSAAPRLPWGRMALGLLVLILVAGVLYAVGMQPRRLPTPFGPAANGSIVFSRDGDLHVTDATGSDERAIVTGADTDIAPSFSRDGTRIAFLRKAGDGPLSFRVMVADADGRNVRDLSTDPLVLAERVEWSPDGSRLAIVHRDGSALAISTVASDGSGRLERLDVGAIAPVQLIGWRPPTGREIVFTGNPDGDVTCLGAYAAVPGTPGAREIVVKAGEGPASGTPPIRTSFVRSVMSSDGSTVLHTDFVAGSDGPGVSSIGRLDIDTGADRPVTYEPAAHGQAAVELSPDRSTVLLVVDPGDGTFVLGTAPTDASAPVRRFFTMGLNPGGHRFATTLSPDGTRVLLVDNAETVRSIEIASGTPSDTVLPRGLEPPDEPLFPPTLSWQRLAP
jgi:dipeptidyl aminopeptidase/acylaminoacyl peptidase